MRMWTTPEEKDFLESLLPEYQACQVKRKYGSFWQHLYADYFAKFPVVEKLYPGVTQSNLTDEQRAICSETIAKQEKRLKEWYRWQMNPRSRNTNANCIISKKDIHAIYNGRSRLLKPYEKFAKLFPDQVEEAKKARCEEQGVKGRQQLAVWHEVAKELWHAATPEQVDAVKRGIVETPSSDSDEPSTSPQAYARYLKKLPSILEAVVTPAVRKAGVLAFVTIVGPSPERNGEVVANSLQFGHKPTTPAFSKTWTGYDTVFADEVVRFARRYEFPPDICAERSLSSSSAHPEDPPLEYTDDSSEEDDQDGGDEDTERQMEIEVIEDVQTLRHNAASDSTPRRTGLVTPCDISARPLTKSTTAKTLVRPHGLENRGTSSSEPRELDAPDRKTTCQSANASVNVSLLAPHTPSDVASLTTEVDPVVDETNKENQGCTCPPSHLTQELIERVERLAEEHRAHVTYAEELSSTLSVTERKLEYMQMRIAEQEKKIDEQQTKITTQQKEIGGQQKLFEEQSRVMMMQKDDMAEVLRRLEEHHHRLCTQETSTNGLQSRVGIVEEESKASNRELQQNVLPIMSSINDFMGATNSRLVALEEEMARTRAEASRRDELKGIGRRENTFQDGYEGLGKRHRTDSPRPLASVAQTAALNIPYTLPAYHALTSASPHRAPPGAFLHAHHQPSLTMQR